MLTRTKIVPIDIAADDDTLVCPSCHACVGIDDVNPSRRRDTLARGSCPCCGLELVLRVVSS